MRCFSLSVPPSSAPINFLADASRGLCGKRVMNARAAAFARSLSCSTSAKSPAWLKRLFSCCGFCLCAVSYCSSAFAAGRGNGSNCQDRSARRDCRVRAQWPAGSDRSRATSSAGRSSSSRVSWQRRRVRDAKHPVVPRHEFQQRHLSRCFAPLMVASPAAPATSRPRRFQELDKFPASSSRARYFRLRCR